MAIKTYQVQGYTIEIDTDEEPENPRSWDNLGVMVCFHRRHSLGDKHSYDSSDFGSWAELEAEIVKNEDVAVMLPLYLYDHSGITMSTRPFGDPWDSGQVGVIFITRAQVINEYGWQRLNKTRLAKLAEYLTAEVKEYDQFLTGDVYGYTITDSSGDHVDSCWGFYGLEYCKAEAEAALNHILENGGSK